MRDILDDLVRWLDEGEEIALGTVVWAEGPSPRPLGSRMVVTASGQMTGSVSGGCVEGAVFREAQSVLGGAPPKRLRYSAVDEEGWEVGLACGGTIEIYVEPLVEVHRRLLEALEADETVALLTRLDGGGHLLAWPDGRLEGDRSLIPKSAAPGSLSIWERVRGEVSDRTAKLVHLPAGDVLMELFAPPPTLTIVGAVHIAMPLSTMARTLGLHVRLVDARRVFATEDRFPQVDELVVAWPQDALEPRYLRPQDAVVVLTHDPKFDVPALETALRSPVGYVGLLGSTSTQAKRQEALRERGFGEEELARIHGPVGLDLGGRKPAEIALAILAEIVAVQHSRYADRAARPGGEIWSA